MKHKLMPRILISLLGAAFILWGSMSVVLCIVGEQATAVITDIRREGGERTDTIPNRYTYNISYTFTVPDGKKIHGFTRKIGNAIYQKADGTGRIDVKYLKELPYINAPEENPPVKQLILFGTGIFLIVLMNRKKSKST